MDPTEEWRQYKDPPYWVSNQGQVKRIYKNGKVKILKQAKYNGGYLKVDITRTPNRIIGKVHAMVAECFIDNPDNKPQVDHINGKKEDNRVSNLRWVTNAENQRNHTQLRITNTSGCVGIHSRKYKGEHYRWRVRIGLDNKRINIGDFKLYDDAVKARIDAEKKYFEEYAPQRD